MNTTFIEFIRRHAHFHRAQLALALKYGKGTKENYIKQYQGYGIPGLEYFMKERNNMHPTDLN